MRHFHGVLLGFVVGGSGAGAAALSFRFSLEHRSAHAHGERGGRETRLHEHLVPAPDLSLPAAAL
jgi:hypothetical protein